MRAVEIGIATLVTGFCLATDAAAVTLNSDGLGQALIYPYYTVRSAGTNAFNTYLTVVNTTSDAKAIRVVMREGHEGRQVLAFNLFLSMHDVWTGAVVPTASGAQLLSADVSCVNPPMDATGTPGMSSYPLLTNDFPEVPSEGAREGYVEMIEMATLTGASYAAVTHNSAGKTNCAAVQGQNASGVTDVAPPSGGLAGTLTLINVNLGMDFTVNAEALANLTTQPFYRNFDSSYPDFNAAEVTPTSALTANGKRYHLQWTNGVDAVSSVMMQSTTINEFVLDSATGSLTDWVLTMPTRRFYVSNGSVRAPFSAGGAAGVSCESLARYEFSYNRESRSGPVDPTIGWSPPPNQGPVPMACHATTVVDVYNGAAHMAKLFGSTNGIQTLDGPFGSPRDSQLYVTETFQNGWIHLDWAGQAARTVGLRSLATSRATDIASGSSVDGAFTVLGLPVLGFMARSFSNGTLDCGAGRCQGNYGSAFPHKVKRSVSAAASTP